MSALRKEEHIYTFNERYILFKMNIITTSSILTNILQQNVCLKRSPYLSVSSCF